MSEVQESTYVEVLEHLAGLRENLVGEELCANLEIFLNRCVENIDDTHIKACIGENEHASRGVIEVDGKEYAPIQKSFARATKKLAGSITLGMMDIKSLNFNKARTDKKLFIFTPKNKNVAGKERKWKVDGKTYTILVCGYIKEVLPGEGVILRSGKDWVAKYIDKGDDCKHLFLSFDPYTSGISDDGEGIILFQHIFEKFLGYNTDYLVASALEKYSRKLYDGKIKQLTGEIKGFGQQKDQALATLTRIGKEEMVKVAQLRGMESTNPMEFMKTEQETLKTLIGTKYEFIDFLDGKIKARTNDINVIWECNTYKFGKFDIMLNIDAGHIQVTAVDKKVKHKSLHHPHINSDGSLCMGNISTDIAGYVKNLQFFQLLDVLFRFLTSYNERDPYCKIEEWKHICHEGVQM